MLNKLFLIGRIGNDFKKTGDQRGYFSLYTTEKSITSSGERKEITETHIISVSGNLVKIAEKTVKTGRLFFVEAILKHVITDGDDNKKSTKTFINAVFIKMLNKSTKEIVEAKVSESFPDKKVATKAKNISGDPFRSKKEEAKKDVKDKASDKKKKITNKKEPTKESIKDPFVEKNNDNFENTEIDDDIPF